MMLDRREVCKTSSACCRVGHVSMERDARLLVTDVRPVEMVRNLGSTRLGQFHAMISQR